MAEHKSKASFNMEDFKNLKEQIENARNEYEEKKEGGEEPPKQSFGQKIIGIIILLAIVVAVIILLIMNIDLLFLPKNSVTIITSDQNGEVIEGLEIYVKSDDKVFTIEYDKESGTDVTELGVTPGEYNLIFEVIPDGYTCSKMTDSFTLAEGEKVKLEYVCTKE